MKLVSWNLLADGMSANEFMTDGGDAANTVWSARKPRILKFFKKFVELKVDVIACQENDHPFEILNGLPDRFKMIHAIKPNSWTRSLASSENSTINSEGRTFADEKAEPLAAFYRELG